MKALAVALVALLGLAGCMSKGEDAEVRKLTLDVGRIATDMRDQGQLTWLEWARATNTLIRDSHPNLSLRMQAALQYREAVAAEVDAGRTTKETANYLIAQKLAEAKSEDDRDASLRRASAPRGPVVCNRVGTAVICD